MIVGFVRKLRHDGLGARAFRSSAWTGMGFILSQVMRLASNLVLTRLLMPEAFGAMALVTAFIIGLVMFSDTGTGPAIQNSARGDDPDFLDTIWTVQAIRGVTLWVFALAIAWPLSVFYDEPILARIFPVAALGLVISGLMPTRMDTALRHLRVGLITRLELISQLITIFITIALTLVLRSIWGLILGGLIGGAVGGVEAGEVEILAALAADLRQRLARAVVVGEDEAVRRDEARRSCPSCGRRTTSSPG